MDTSQDKLHVGTSESDTTVDEVTPLLHEQRKDVDANPDKEKLLQTTSTPKDQFLGTSLSEEEIDVQQKNTAIFNSANVSPCPEEELLINPESSGIGDVAAEEGNPNSQEVTVNSEESTTEADASQNAVVQAIFASWGRVIGFWRHISQSMIEFKIAVILSVLLLPIPISAGFMAARYIFSCPASKNISYILFILGVFPTMAILTRICIYVHIECSGYRHMTSEQKMSVGMLDVGSILFFCVEIIEFSRMSPSFDEWRHNYCDPKFYHYIYCMNILTPVLMLLTFILHLPNIPRWLRNCA